MRNAIANRICARAQVDRRLYVIAGDAGLGVWDQFQIDYPDQFLNPGVNEQCDVGMAAGMALLGYRVVYYNITPFVIMRPYEQVRNDICYQELPVLLVGTGSGVTYAPAGVTHYAVEDIALARTMPGLEIYSPADAVEAKACFDHCLARQRPAFIRIAKSGEATLHADAALDVAQPQLLFSGKDVLLLTHGSIADQVTTVRSILLQHGVTPTIATVPMLTTTFDFQPLLAAHRHVFILEEHFVTGGLGSLLTEFCNGMKPGRRIHKLGLPNQYIHCVGNREYMLRRFGLDGEQVARRILETVKTV